MEADKFLKSVIENNEDKCEHKKISQALKMICSTNENQSFFLFFLNKTNFGIISFASHIFKWRISWFDHLGKVSRNSFNGFTGFKNISNNCKLMNLSEFLTKILLNRPKKVDNLNFTQIKNIKNLTIFIEPY